MEVRIKMTETKNNLTKTIKKIFVKPQLVVVSSALNNYAFSRSYCYGGQSK